MRTEYIPAILLAAFCFLCGHVVAGDANDTGAQLIQAKPPILEAEAGSSQILTIGATYPDTEDPETGFRFQLELDSRGAAIRRVTFSSGEDKGFDDRDHKNPKPLALLSPVKFKNGREILSLANNEFVFVNHGLQLRLNNLHWQCHGVEIAPNGCQKATFIAKIKDLETGTPLIKVTKSFKVFPGSYLAYCDVEVENLAADGQEVRFNLGGPVGISREGVRTDMRKVVGGFIGSEGTVISSRKAIGGGKPCFLIPSKKVGLKDSNANYAEALRTGDKSQIEAARRDLSIGRNLPDNEKNAKFIWGAAANKYFSAILVPVPDEPNGCCDWIKETRGHYYDPDQNEQERSGKETLGFDYRMAPVVLAAAGQEEAVRKYSFEIYLGPKDKSLFDDKEHYQRLGFVQTIDFMACCCPASIIRPLAFFIVWLMNTLHQGIPNYGIVIFILVFLVRLILHPLTKKGQVRMNRFTKLANVPEIQEIKKKYAKSPMEMQKKTSEFYKSRGVSPADMLFGMLPMFMQMPLWIALWTAVNSSIDLRGAEFLPFWITDLSVPDALLRWEPVTLPLLGWKISSLNLLPLLMGVAFYVQQKMMPQQAAASKEMETQQKMMKIMMLLMFPIMLYNAPSGVSLYIMASTFAGAIEQYVIRKHIREKDEAESRGLIEVTSKTGGKVKKKKPKPFMKRYM